MGKRRISVIVRGRVQGVNFRWYTRRCAMELGIVGRVRNLRGGDRVKVVAEGSQEQMADLIRFLHEGPPSAHVDDVEITWEPASGEYKDFRVSFR